MDKESQLLLMIWLAALLLSVNETQAITPHNVKQIEVLQRTTIVGTYAAEMAFNPVDRRQLAVAQADGQVTIWDAPTGGSIAQWYAAETALNAIAYTPDGNLLITASQDGIKVWDTTAFSRLLKTLTLPDQIPLVIAAAPNNIIAVGYKDGNVRLWDIETGTNILTLYGYNNPVNIVNFSPDASYLGFGHKFGPLFIYKLEDITRQQVYFEQLIEDGELSDFAFLPSPTAPPFLGDIVIVTAGFEGAGTPIQAWDEFIYRSNRPPTWKPQSTMAYPDSLSFNHEGSLLAVFGKVTDAGGGCDTNLCAIEIIGMPFDPNSSEFSGQVLVTLGEHKAWPVDVVFSSDSRYLASSSNDGLILVWGFP
jgi:WD40 repeat protein